MAALARAAYGEGGPAIPDVSSNVSAKTTRVWVALDVHRNGITAGLLLPAEGGQLELAELENSEKAIRRLVGRLGGREGLSVSVTRRARVAMTCTGC